MIGPVATFKKSAKTIAAATAVALALCIPMYAGAAQPKSFEKTAFERNVIEIAKPCKAVFLTPGAYCMMGAIAAGLVETVEDFSVTTGASSTTGTDTLTTSVDTSRSSVIYGGQTGTSTAGAGADPNSMRGRVDLTNTNTVTITRNTASANTITITGWVMQWKASAVESIQQRTLTLTGAASAVDTLGTTLASVTNAAVFYLGESTTDSSSAAERCYSRCNITSTSQVTVTRGSATSNVTVCFVVVEWKAGILNSVTQEKTITLTGASSNTGSLSPSVTPAQTMLVYGGFSGTMSNNDQSKKPYAALTAVNTITVTRTSSTDNVTMTVTAVEFKSASVVSIQRITIAIGSGATTNDLALSPAVVLANTIGSFLGFTNSTTVTRTDTGMARITIPSTTVERAHRNTSDVNTVTVSVEAIYFTI